MSWLPSKDPAETGVMPEGVDLLVVPRVRDIGGFEVRRALPSVKRKTVGPFVFLDQMGPTEVMTGSSLDVRPHPHIGLSTLTYLLSGSIVHRDSLGTVSTIEPGAVNWMTAGRGIAHSERTSPLDTPSGQTLFGLQAWVALPKAKEEGEPSFLHHGADKLPEESGEGVTARVVAGTIFGRSSPLSASNDAVYADIAMAPGARLDIPATVPDRALYLVSGEIAIEGQSFAAGQLIVLKPGAIITLATSAPARMILMGGEPLDGPRHIWWNFVSSSKERIEAAKADWAAGRFAAVPGDDEALPLPGR
ncbi:pirin family protein [Fodinicurvata sp. EGI_FJ10296]|uniref:pirin family protein n=1 Tax=Fodinicurvata sp. EGI_FJ10296 TaxID=3231908 RepID=UPI00345595D5